MDNLQVIINFVGALLLFLVSMIARASNSTTNELKATNRKTQEELAAVLKELNQTNVLLAGSYVKKEELERILDLVSDKLDKIENFDISVSRDYATKDEVVRLGERLASTLQRIEEKLDRKVDR